MAQKLEGKWWLGYSIFKLSLANSVYSHEYMKIVTVKKILQNKIMGLECQTLGSGGPKIRKQYLLLFLIKENYWKALI